MSFMSTMQPMNIRDFDLNLLHVFSAVHAARSVSRAAEVLGLSQPAVSHALTKLRLALHDPLFTRAPGGVARSCLVGCIKHFLQARFRVFAIASRLRRSARKNLRWQITMRRTSRTALRAWRK